MRVVHVFNNRDRDHTGSLNCEVSFASSPTQNKASCQKRPLEQPQETPIIRCRNTLQRTAPLCNTCDLESWLSIVVNLF